MTEYAFDMVLNTEIRVEADNLGEAVQYLRDQLDCYSPEFGIQLPTGGVSGVEKATLTQISLGNHTKRDGAPAAALTLFEADGKAMSDVELDDMAEPHVCDQRDQGDVDCYEVYDEARGDGYCGMCPACADAEKD